MNREGEEPPRNAVPEVLLVGQILPASAEVDGEVRAHLDPLLDDAWLVALEVCLDGEAHDGHEHVVDGGTRELGFDLLDLLKTQRGRLGQGLRDWAAFQLSHSRKSST